MHPFQLSLSNLDPKQRDAYLTALFRRLMREGDERSRDEGSGGDGECKFGRVPSSEDPNRHLGQAPQHGPGGPPPQRHPYLSRTQRFSGIDKRLSPSPTDNEAARQKFPALRLQQQLRKALAQRYTPTLGR